ncbi:uncharacterized protein LOC114776983 [Denticeps clupeoides]|uniref:uncharacterized protein LOC114776983 n=1 Tax=Denticeps clupeoides TaxID=299321 RepID=UPI0010A310AA|nr:uncharacterized protein LOC114776983 [Denticeps clupeoides]
MLPRYYCIAHGCGISQGPYVEEKGITFHRFPFDDPERLQLWLSNAKRDRWSITSRSVLCSKHFADDCFDGSGETVTLRQDAVPTVDISPVAPEVTQTVDDSFMELEEPHLNLVEDTPHLEHPLCRRKGGPEDKGPSRSGRPTTFSDSFSRLHFKKFDALEKYLRFGTYANGQKKSVRQEIRRYSKKFSWKDGVLYYCRGTKHRRVLRNQEEVNTVLKEFHDNRGHYGLKKCLAPIADVY